jgi:hypothetical protein
VNLTSACLIENNGLTGPTSYIRALQEKKLIDKNIQVLAATINNRSSASCLTPSLHVEDDDGVLSLLHRIALVRAFFTFSLFMLFVDVNVI